MTAARTIPPGPQGKWLTGSLDDFIKQRLEFLTHCAATYGDVSSFRIGRRRIFLVNHPDLIGQVLVTDSKNYIKHFGARMYKPVLGNGLVTSEGDFWLRQRRLAQPAFLKQRLAGYGPVMVELTERMLTHDWRDGQRIDVHAEMSKLTSDIALKTLFDLDSGAKSEIYTAALREVFQLISARFRSVIKLPYWVPIPRHLRMQRSLKRLQSLVNGFIQQGRARKEPGEDLLSTLIFAQDDDGSRMTDGQLLDEAMTLYLAGHETTALTLAWTWYALSQHPEVEEKLVAEWSTVLMGGRPTMDDLPQLVYTEAVITEAMRIYPPVYLVGREAITECEIGGFSVPRGTTMFLSQWVTHRDPRFYDDPLEFRPERWLDGLAKRLPKYAYFPFGAGPRVCIGNGFAMMEAVLLLATIGSQYHFTLEPEPPVAFNLGITLLPENGIPAILKRRGVRHDHAQSAHAAAR